MIHRERVFCNVIATGQEGMNKGIIGTRAREGREELGTRRKG